jgi:hypothetical protein
VVTSEEEDKEELIFLLSIFLLFKFLILRMYSWIIFKEKVRVVRACAIPETSKELWRQVLGPGDRRPVCQAQVETHLVGKGGFEKRREGTRPVFLVAAPNYS